MGNLTPKTSGVGRISVANEELINLPSDWTVRNYKVIEFYSAQNCTLIWNNEIELEIMAEAGLKLDESFKPTESLKIKESGIPFYFAVGY